MSSTNITHFTDGNLNGNEKNGRLSDSNMSRAGLSQRAMLKSKYNIENSSVSCMQVRYWPYYVSSMLVVFFGGLLWILLVRGCVALTAFVSKKCQAKQILPLRQDIDFEIEARIENESSADSYVAESLHKEVRSRNQAKADCDLASCATAFHRYTAIVMSYQSISGRIFMTANMLLSLVSFGIYVHEAIYWPSEVERCGDNFTTLRILELSLNLFFLLNFIGGLAASDERLQFWVDWFSILDYLTVPPTILAFIVNRSWIGLRFLRIFRLINIAEVLHNLTIIHSVSSIRFCKVCSFFLSVWLAGAGMMCLLENTGDPFGVAPYGNAVVVTYREGVYWSIVTMSTVGYGDLSPQTVLGQMFCCVFILLALAAFASCIPEIVEIFLSRGKYAGKYIKQRRGRHVVVCGGITPESVKHFLNDFLHADRQRTDVEVVFLNPMKPDVQLKNIIRRHHPRVHYFQGTVMNCVDLKRVVMSHADACLVLANSSPVNPNEEDAGNIMRIVAVKNYASNIRCIVQILRQVNKSYLLNIPMWNWRTGDEVVCCSELKLGFLAQSCIAPGFSTLLINLFSMNSLNGRETIVGALSSDQTPTLLATKEDLDNEKQSEVKRDSWMAEYLLGVGNELYSATFSSAFKNMDFVEAGCLCMTRLGLMLIAIVVSQDEEIKMQHAVNYLAINPSASSEIVISDGTVGFFICDSQEIANRATNYCTSCHFNTPHASQIRACSCPRHDRRQVSATISRRLQKIDFGGDEEVDKKASGSSKNNKGGDVKKLKSAKHDDEKVVHDVTGVYHWCPKRSLESAILPNNLHITSTIADAELTEIICNHVLVCILTSNKAPLLGLRSFVLPLRSSNIPKKDLRTIVLLGDIDYLREEWSDIANFDDVYILPGSPLYRNNLWSARIQACSVAVVIGVSDAGRVDDPYLLDKEVILCSLNIRALKMPMVIRNSASLKIATRSSGAEIPVLTALAMDSNIHFLNPDDTETGRLVTEICFSAPFARGLAFTDSVLDALVSTAYFDRNAMTLIRNLVTGGTTPVLERWAAHGGDFYDNLQTPNLADDPQMADILRHLKQSSCKGTQLNQLSFDDPRLRNIMRDNQPELSFGNLFCAALRKEGILCLGLFRLHPMALSMAKRILFNRFEAQQQSASPKKRADIHLLLGPISANDRYVITNPHFTLPVNQFDLLFCLTP